MKSAYIQKPGPADSICYGDLPTPACGPRDVLVRMTAVCVDPVDIYIRSGALPLQLPLPFIIGRDLVGVVEQVGAEVADLAPGDRVWCNNQGFDGRQGTFAEQLVIDRRWLYRAPAGAQDKELVAFVHAGLTAHVGLSLAHLKAGESVFVQGASGSVGSAIVQLAKARGARVFGTAGSAAGLEWCRSLGADEVHDYHSADMPLAAERFAKRGFDVFWDTSGHHDFDRAVGLLGQGGRIVLMAGQAARPARPVGPFYVKNASLLGFAVTYAPAELYDSAAEEINRGFAAGLLKVRIDRVLPLSAAAEAHRLVESGRLSGKIVLVP